MPTPAPSVPAVGPDAWRAGPADGALAPVACAQCRAAPGWFHPRSQPARTVVTSPEAAARVFAPLAEGADRERCLAALLDTRHRLLATALVSVGSVDHTFMAPREVFRDALLANASAVVLAHNHPSGDPEPSDDDVAVTHRLAAAGNLVGVELLDHLVLAGERWVSLARRGVL